MSATKFNPVHSLAGNNSNLAVIEVTQFRDHVLPRRHHHHFFPGNYFMDQKRKNNCGWYYGCHIRLHKTLTGRTLIPSKIAVSTVGLG